MSVISVGARAGGEASENTSFHPVYSRFAFVLGFSMVFITLGRCIVCVGRLYFDLRVLLSKVGGVVVIIFGLHMIGVFRFPSWNTDTRVQQLPDRKWGGSLLAFADGRLLSAGWAPCVARCLLHPDDGPKWRLDLDGRLASFPPTQPGSPSHS